MKKLIKLDFNNTTRERKTEDSYSELYSHDKNNGSFEFEILNDTLTTEQVIALFKFTESNKIWKTTGTVEGNKVNVTFDTTLITQNETVICFLYFDEEQRTSDTFRFKFKVKVSEIDKMSRYQVKERFINNTVIVDRLDVVTKDELKETLKGLTVSNVEGLLTETKADEIYAKKSEIYDDTALSGRVKTLEDAPKVNVENFATKDDVVAFNRELNNKVSSVDFEAFKMTIPQPYNDKALSDRVLALENKPVNRYEIHGTGMPNRVVEAEIGTIYVDTNNTNGALKWIKTTDGGYTGWRVFTGDTGWRTLPLVNKRGNARLQIRRINDEVIVKFDGLQYGWFGVDDMEKQGGNIVNKTIGDKKYTWIKLNVGQKNNVLPVGFRSASSLLTGLYGDLGDLLGSVYVGGTADDNAIQLRYAMPRNELTNTMLSQIRISPVTFITDDPWPTQLP